ncbi:MAG: VWA domain-containing protein, partial [Thermomicrobiales bacterium]
MPDLTLSFARGEALWLLLILPLIAAAGLKFGRRRGMRPATIWLRVGAVAFLCLALAEPLVGAADAATSTIFVVDRSSSIDPTTSSMVNEWVNDALAAGGSSDRAAVIAFGAEPNLLTASVPVDDVQPDVINGGSVKPSATNIEAALSMARAL